MKKYLMIFVCIASLHAMDNSEQNSNKVSKKRKKYDGIFCNDALNEKYKKLKSLGIEDAQIISAFEAKLNEIEDLKIKAETRKLAEIICRGKATKQTIKDAIKKGADLNKFVMNIDICGLELAVKPLYPKIFIGGTPLEAAVLYGKDIKIIRDLLDEGANPNGAGNLALYYAVRQRSQAITRIFLEKGVDEEILKNPMENKWESPTIGQMIEKYDKEGW